MRLRFRTFAALAISYISLALPCPSQTHQNDPQKDQKMLEQATTQGIKLPMTTVNKSIRVEAVLLPFAVANRVFGKEIANTYAVIELTISNKSSDSSFILHGAFIDYSRWGLSGLSVQKDNVPGGGSEDPTVEQTQAGTESNQVASTEYRVARGQLLDAQQWNARNWTIRLLTLGGSLASGYSFAFKETGIAKGIAAFNGNFVPGMANAWPDGTVAQLNRISDFGYQTNKVIPKQSADIVVCFFPIDRFLTPGFKKLFKKSPAIFFAPLQMLQDKSMEGDLLTYLPSLDQETLDEARELLPCYLRLHPRIPKTATKKTVGKWNEGDDKETAAKANDGADQERFDPDELAKKIDAQLDKNCYDQLQLKDATPKFAYRFLELIETVSLNNIRIVVDGIMSVDTNLVPAKIDLVTFDQDDKSPAFWAVPGEKSGTIKGDYLSAGEVSIADSDKLGITEIKTINSGSDEHNLKFSFKLTKAIETGTKLTFKIGKKNDDKTGTGKTAESMNYDYVVGYTATAPQVNEVTIKDKSVTVTGSGFYNTATNPLTASLRPQAESGDAKDVKVKFTKQTDKELDFDVPDSIATGCYKVIVKINTMQAIPSNTLVPVPATQKCK
jgi:hypothetical protein